MTSAQQGDPSTDNSAATKAGSAAGAASPSLGNIGTGSLPDPDADAPPRALEPGRKLGQYTIVEKIGEGGMGLVYKATDTMLERAVALKVMFCGEHEDQRQAQRFIREARAMARLAHPNLVHVYSVGSESGCHYFAMELLRGETLLQTIRRLHRIPAPEMLHYAVQIISALYYVHSNSITHRDIKSGNIMLCGRRAVLMDFGLAKDETDSGLTTAGQIMGTPDYMPPEAAEGRSEGPPTDIYSFGVVLYEALSGRLPFTGKSAISIIRQHIDTAPPPLQSYVPEIRPELAEIVHKCLEKLPQNRFANCPELAAALWELVPEQALLDIAEQRVAGGDGIPMPASASRIGKLKSGAPTVRSNSAAGPTQLSPMMNPTVTQIDGLQRASHSAALEETIEDQPAAVAEPASGKSRRWLWAAAGFIGMIVAVALLIAFKNKNKAPVVPVGSEPFAGQPIVRKGAPNAEKEILMEFKGNDPDQRNWYFIVKRQQPDGSWKELKIAYRDYVSQKSDTELIFPSDEAQRKP